MTSKSGSTPDENELPKSVISRIAKKAVPAADNVLIATETKIALAKSAKMFILYLSACANDICHDEGKTRITADHVMKAMDELEFGFSDTVKECFEEYRKEQAQKKTKKTAATSASTTTSESADKGQPTAQPQQESKDDMDVTHNAAEEEDSDKEEEQNEEESIKVDDEEQNED